MENTTSNTDGLPKEIADALNMPDKEYIELLENHISDLVESNVYGHEAIRTFVDLLEFIGENFGETKDFPIRVDNDFYESLFLEKLTACQKSLEHFLESYDEMDYELDAEDSSDPDEDEDEDEDEDDDDWKNGPDLPDNQVF